VTPTLVTPLLVNVVNSLFVTVIIRKPLDFALPFRDTAGASCFPRGVSVESYQYAGGPGVSGTGTAIYTRHDFQLHNTPMKFLQDDTKRRVRYFILYFHGCHGYL